MVDLDLAALTEAEQQVCRVNTGGACDGRCAELKRDHCDCFGWEPEHAREVVRVVLEALPREWGARNRTTGALAWPWPLDETATRAVCPPGGDYELVQRAVGPPIPADEPQDAP